MSAVESSILVTDPKADIYWAGLPLPEIIMILFTRKILISTIGLLFHNTIWFGKFFNRSFAVAKIL
jgi:hypothetical protein